MSVVPAPRLLLRDVALARLREAIVTGELPPGGVVKDAELATRLDLSVAPVRAALARLADEGLVESVPQSHTRVTAVVPGIVRDAAAVVAAMHELAVRTAVPHVTADDVAAMRDANAAFARAVRTGAVDDALTSDDALHDVLVVRAGNGAVRATIDRFTPLVRRLERQRFAAAHGAASVELHDQLITACQDGDVAVAVATTTAIWTALLSELTEETE
ncbi:DNA-binding transcriptional regulator, GntR family [Klenkia soli]|uniref:DNA-binding transcriptional regulator, GntR family n=1 Tax=Klenkia soli TaxID=1052260 RepID=A0A1H0QZ82_9ACTN|nr:GntR family transcriptional regulator [Klenkia soli]SDP22527.1 DNA-binding transcriptional regulator, GntR family [Klenkia soli]